MAKPVAIVTGASSGIGYELAGKCAREGFDLVTVTCLMPGATETDVFERADWRDTKVGQSEKNDPADVAEVGFDAMMRGERDVAVVGRISCKPRLPM